MVAVIIFTGFPPELAKKYIVDITNKIKIGSLYAEIPVTINGGQRAKARTAIMADFLSTNLLARLAKGKIDNPINSMDRILARIIPP